MSGYTTYFEDNPQQTAAEFAGDYGPTVSSVEFARQHVPEGGDFRGVVG